MTQPESSGRKSGSRLVDDGLLEEFGPLIRYLAYRFSFRLPPSMEAEDLVHAGVLGLIDALGKYDSSREARFRTYAEFRIRGAMLDEIRRQNWVPRSIREKVTLLNRTTDELVKRLGREPDEDELALELKMDRQALEEFLVQANAASLLSLDDFGLEQTDEKIFYEALIDEESEDPLFSLLNRESREKLIEAVSGLPEKEKLVVSLYYSDGLNLKEIGKVLKLTESRVCQIHSRAISRLRSTLLKPE